MPYGGKLNTQKLIELLTKLGVEDIYVEVENPDGDFAVVPITGLRVEYGVNGDPVKTVILI